VKLLRVLQEREFARVGGTRCLAVDVRILAATHQDLEAQVAMITAIPDSGARQDWGLSQSRGHS